MTLVARQDEPLVTDCAQARAQVRQSLDTKGIRVVTNSHIQEILPDRVRLDDGRELESDVAVWATGAEAHSITTNSDLEIMDGFFRVNNFL